MRMSTLKTRSAARLRGAPRCLPRPSIARGIRLGLCALLSVGALGCELLLGDIPRKRHAAADGAMPEVDEMPDPATSTDADVARDAAPSGDNSGDENEAGASSSHADASTGPGVLDATNDATAAAGDRDADTNQGTPQEDGATGEPPDDSDAAPSTEDDAAANVDSSSGMPEPNACGGAPARLFFLDRDRDGYGDPESARTACDRPDPEWVEAGQDCDDTNGEVHPQQADFFGSAYQSPASGRFSFDYNCDGTEVPRPNQEIANGCNGLGLLCGGGGYLPNEGRVGGPGSFPQCGSNMILTCALLDLSLACTESYVLTDAPFECN